MSKLITKSSKEKEFYLKSAEIFRIMSNAKRLEIMDIVKEREVTVNDISKALGTRKSNTSQHLAYLRYLGIVIARRDGKNIYYKLVDPKIMQSCNVLDGFKIKPFLG